MCCHLVADMCKVGGGIAEHAERGTNDFTFEPLPDCSRFWFGLRGPERCFLLEDPLLLIMMPEDEFVLTLP